MAGERKMKTDVRNKETDNVEKVVKINRVNKVVKGGKRLAFRVFVICGDQKGQVGIGIGKSKEVPTAIKKAIEKANKNFKKFIVHNNTLPHEVHGKAGSAKVLIKPAKEGTGVIAGGALRVILESIGIKDAVGKSLGSRNPINMALATLDALGKCKDLKQEEIDRNIVISSRNKEG